MVLFTLYRTVERGVYEVSLFKSKRSKKYLLIMVMGLMVLLLAGCGTSGMSTGTTTEAMRTSGSFWKENVVYWFSLALDTFARWFNGEYGLAILVMVIIVRTIILPLTLKQVRSSRAMQAIQPQILKLKEQYKDSPEKQQQETMKLFQENGVNPMAGCFPLLIQMPVFIALYNSIYNNSAIREHAFLWLQLGEPDKFLVLPILAAITTFIQTKMMMSMNPSSAVGPMKFMMFIYPVLIFVMSYSFPAALPLYWFYSNIYTIVQNYFLYRNNAPATAIASTGPEEKKKGKGGSNLKAGSQPRSASAGKGAKEAKKSK